MAQITSSMLNDIEQAAERGARYPLTANETKQLVFLARSAIAAQAGEPAGAQAGGEWVEEAMRLALKWADDRSSDDPASPVVDSLNALRAHLTTVAAIPEAKEKP